MVNGTASAQIGGTSQAWLSTGGASGLIGYAFGFRHVDGASCEDCFFKVLLHILML